ncbi:MAG: response regulator [Spirochaetes bacterium]|nr:response regulator [Spirochaetota bacterium]MBN2771600.1 response regulator [Spirochaetota bacterium]
MNSIRTKFIIFYLMLSISAMVLIISITYENQIDLVVKNTRLEIENQFNSLIQNFRHYLNQEILSGVTLTKERYVLLIKDTFLKFGDTIAIFEEDGKVLYSSDVSMSLPDDYIQNGLLSISQNTFSGMDFFIRSIAEKNQYDIYIPFEFSTDRTTKKIILYINKEIIDIKTKKNALYRQSAYILSILVITHILFVIFMFRKIILPIEILKSESEEIKKGNLDRTITLNSNDEFEILALYFNEMRKSIQSNLLQLNNQIEIVEKAKNELAALDRLKNDFIANITHDLRSPLSGIQGLAELALFKDKKDRFHETFEMIYFASTKLSRTIDQLLELARMDSAQIQLKIQKIDIVFLLESVVKLYESKTFGKNITINKWDPDITITDFYGDAEKIEHIFNNILSNSIKFCADKHGIIDIDIIDHVDYVRISFMDNGIGIPADKLNIIFKRFARVHSDSHTKLRGTGIGLAFVDQLLRLLNADITVESDGENKGSKFTLIFKKGKSHFSDKNVIWLEEDYDFFHKDSINIYEPDLIQPPFESEFISSEPIIHIDKTKDRKQSSPFDSLILIVDDDYIFIKIVHDILQNAGYHNFIMAFNGGQGANAVFQYSPDIIISDFNMPELNGLQFIDLLSKNPDVNTIPFVFLTALSDEEHQILFRKHGAVDFLKKPVNKKLLELCIKHHLEKYLQLKNDKSRKTSVNSLEREKALEKRKQLLQTINILDFKNKLIQIIENEKLFCDEDLTIQRLSSIMNIHRNDLSLLINELFGKNYNVFINEYRINYAIELFNNHPNKSILDVAYSCGFNSYSPFYNAFKKITGQSPEQYKSQQTIDSE